MKISLAWLSDYVDVDGSAEEIAERLSDLGFPCEGIEVGSDDTVIDVEVTSNRGDCLGHIGVARELAAATGKTLRLPDIEFPEMDREVSELVSVHIEDPSLCARYTARVIEAVTVGPSPAWLVKRLEAIGLRTVNNVVDATNYALMESGHPPHAFDLAKIAQGTISVRRARQGESLVSIDATRCELTEDMLIIADGQGPVALAGVMGGLDTEVSADTTTILLEAAHFAPTVVRFASRSFQLPSDAAFRFERRVDVENIEWASRRTAQLITQVAGGRVVRGVVDCYPGGVPARSVTMRLARLHKLLGLVVPADAVVTIFERLGFKPHLTGEEVLCTIPSWRNDIDREVDLIEEVARSYGYDRIPIEPQMKIEVTPVDARQKRQERVTQRLNAHGYFETVNVDFVDDVTAGLFSVSSTCLAVRNTSRKSANKLRQLLLGSLLQVLRTNVNAKTLPCRVFELASTFVPSGAEGALPEERTKVALVADEDFRALRGAVEGVVDTVIGGHRVVFEPAEFPWAGVGAQIKVNDQWVGVAGVFSEEVTAKMDIKTLQQPVGAELDLELLAALARDTDSLQPIPRFPAIERDLSVLVDEHVAWADIDTAVWSEAPDALTGLEFVEIYRGKGTPSGHKSVTLSLRFRDRDGTLTHDVVDRFQSAIVQRLMGRLGAQLRAV